MEEAAQVTEEVAVMKAEDSTTATSTPATETPVVEEGPVDEDAPVSHPMSYLAQINVWHLAEQRLGQLVRSVTVHVHGDYATLHAFPAEGPVTHQEVNLGRI